ncbi:MAG: lytic murein transglycosylase [Brevirhabdus sp.]
MKKTTALIVAMVLATPVGAFAPEVSPLPVPRLMKGPIVEVAQPARFKNWIRAFRARAKAQGISEATLDRAFRGVKYRADVIEKDRNQSEFTKQIWEYLDTAVSGTRVKNGKAALRKKRQVLAKIERAYGVEAEVVAAIWGLESAYGTFRGDVPIIDALSTLAYDGRRGRFFEGQLVAALKILQAGDVTPRKMTGSWAGAMGHTQFIPTSYLSFAVDFTGDGKRDIWSDNPADALASTAAYLKRHGWTYGQPWGMEVKLPRDFPFGLAGERIKKSPAEWNAMGIRTISGKPIPNHGRASILLPGGARGAAFVIFDNFHVIERYNTADAYVIAVGHLADRIQGGPPIKASWPRGDRPLSFTEKKEMQRLLTAKGFDTEGVDGIIGPNTIQAVREFQASIGLTPDGWVSLDILKRLR